MPQPNGTMTFEEWLQDLVEHTQFDDGDSPEKFLKLGEAFLEEEFRKEEQRLRARHSRRYLGKKDDKSWRKTKMKKLSRISTQVINYQGMHMLPKENSVLSTFSVSSRED